jgi:hypothetical protein
MAKPKAVRKSVRHRYLSFGCPNSRRNSTNFAGQTGAHPVGYFQGSPACGKVLMADDRIFFNRLLTHLLRWWIAVAEIGIFARSEDTSYVIAKHCKKKYR